jgi:ABC-type dipeptide/oligopeptide/nickel transport system permease subunit
MAGEIESLPRTGAAAETPGRDREIDEVDLIPVRTYWELVRRRFIQHRLAVIALVVLVTLVTIAIVVPLLTGKTYRLSNLALKNAGPSLAAPLGYDEIGINIGVRLVSALKTSLIIGGSAVLIIVGIGTFVGAVAGYAGGWLDNLMMRLVDVVLSLPVLFIILMIVSFFGVGDVRVVVIAIGITGWTVAARLIRAEFLSLRDADFVQAARALGAGHRRIIMRHMLPSAMAPLVVAAALGVADSVVVEAALSFLGFGISPPEASLGNMLNKVDSYFYTAPERILYPSVVLVLIVLCASFLGDGLRDALDPRQRIEA